MRRRVFLRLLAAQAAATAFGCGPGQREGEIPALPDPDRWLGDDFSLGHRIRGGALDLSNAAPGKTCDAIVVGGGISGLAAAWRLARSGRSVLVLEQAAVAGGNAKSERWGEIDYAIGAAYFCDPEGDEDLSALYTDLGLRTADGRMTVAEVPGGEAVHEGRIVRDLWTGESDPASAADFGRIRDEWAGMFDRRYPAVPWSPKTTGWSRAEFERMDRTPFSRTLDELRAPRHVRAYCEHYCWSAFGGAASEVSSYAPLNFLTAEFGNLFALPGGNAGVAHRLVRRLEALGVEIRTRAIAGSIRTAGTGAEVRALEPDGPRLHRAGACVVAVPRFMTKRIVDDYPAARLDEVSRMKWRSYVVGNLLLRGRPGKGWYDAYRIDDCDPRSIGWTDLILADHVKESAADYCVITAYRPLPWDDARPGLEAEETPKRYRAELLRDVAPALPALGLRESQIAGSTFARWGHPMVLARPGQLSDGSLERVSAPLTSISFAQQDRYGLPAIEPAIHAGLDAAAEALAHLGTRA